MSIFTKAPAVKAMKERFAFTPALQGLCKLSDDFIFAKVQAAENTVATRLRTFLEPTQVFCSDDVTQADLDAAELAGLPVYQEPGYDYKPDFFRDNSWGMMLTRHKPIIAVQNMRFSYIDPRISSYTVPQSWIRLDKKYGMVRLLPSGETAQLPLNAYLLSVFGGARTIPNMIRLTYTSGITDLAKNFPGLLDFIYRYAAFLMILDRFPGNSSSISADGLSQSEGFDLKSFADAFTGSIENELKVWGDAIHGVRLMVA